MVTSARKTISTPMTSVDLEYETLGGALKTIISLIEHYGEDASIRKYAPSYDGDSEYLYVYKDVPETDAQWKARVDLETRNDLARDKRERAEFERLSKKFK